MNLEKLKRGIKNQTEGSNHMDKKLSEVEIRMLKKKSDEANTLIRASKVNSHRRVIPNNRPKK